METAEEEESAGNVVQLPAIHVELSGIAYALSDVAEQLLPMPLPVASISTAYNSSMPTEPTQSTAYQSPLPPPPPHPLPVALSEFIRPVIGDASSEWSSSRRTGRRSSTGASSARLLQETHTSSSHSPTVGSPVAASYNADTVDKEEEDAGGRDHGSEDTVTEPKLSLESCLPEIPLEIVYNEPPIATEPPEEAAQTTANIDELAAAQSEGAEATAEPIDSPNGDKDVDADVDADDDSLVCVSPPNEEEQTAGHDVIVELTPPVHQQASSGLQTDERHEHELTADMSSMTRSPVSSESPTDETSRHQTPPNPAPTVRYTFLTEVHGSNAQEATATADEGSSGADAEPASGDDDDTPIQPSPIAQEETESNWITCVTDAGVAYYYNPQTQESQWTPPVSHTAEVRTSSDATTSPASSPSLTPQDALFAAVAGTEPFASQLQAMLQAGASLHEINDVGLTPLHVACQCGNVFAASLLLYYGARPDGVPGSSSLASPLFVACRANNVELMQLLVEYGAQLTTTDRDGSSLMHVAVTSQSSGALLLLLDLVSADSPSGSSSSLLDDGNSDGETPLHLAVKIGYVDAVRALLRYGAATDVEDSLGRTPLVLSIMENQVECVQLLQELSTSSGEPETKPAEAATYEAVEKSFERLPGSMAVTADLDELQSYIFQLLPGVAEDQPEVHRIIYQFCSETRQRMSSLALELQGLRENENKRHAQIEELTTEHASVTQELTKVHAQALFHDQPAIVERDELLRTQELLESQQLELYTLRVSHQALASRCEMLDAIARTAQEKLKRERAEHSHYEEQMQVHLSSTTDENARLVATLSELEASWNQRLEQQQQQQQQTQQQQMQQQSQERSEEKTSGSGNDDDDEFYYTQYGELDQETPGDAAMAASYEYAQYYSAGDTGTLTPVEEPSEYYYSNENEGDDTVHLNETATTNSPPISPSRVDAVWNKFFENMAVAAERQPVSSSQRQQEHQHQASPRSSALNKPASGGSAYNQAVNTSPGDVFMAIRRSNFAELQRLLLSGMAANVRDIGEKGTPLHLACELGDLDAMKLLCEFAADVEVRDEAGNTPLLVACSQGHYECTKFLLQSAASLSVVNSNGDSALHLAAWDGSADCVEILFEYGVDSLATNSFALTPLANLKTRSPLRHKFDDLVDEHPIRRTLVLLEEMEQQALEERDEAEQGDEDKEHEPEHHATRLDNGDHHEKKKSSSNPNQAGERERPSTSKTSWKDWLLSGFSAKPKQEEAGEEEPNDSTPRGDEGHEQDTNAESDENEEDDDTSSFEDSLHIYEPLRPPPEIEAELLRAKLQLKRPAALASSKSYEDDNDDEDDLLASIGMAGDAARDRDGGIQIQQQPQQHFVAADRRRMMAAKPSKKPASAAVNLRARYVDIFNPV